VTVGHLRHPGCFGSGIPFAYPSRQGSSTAH
jgi:hypothetical protein